MRSHCRRTPFGYRDSEASPVHTIEPCPGCAASFARYDGATHSYIGASAACWALHSAVLVGGEPPVEVLSASSVAPVYVSVVGTPPHASALLLDAYAAQHHGVPSPQAIQSVAVHLLVLHGVLARAALPEAALWIRRQAMRCLNSSGWPDGQSGVGSASSARSVRSPLRSGCGMRPAVSNGRHWGAPPCASRSHVPICESPRECKLSASPARRGC